MTKPWELKRFQINNQFYYRVGKHFYKLYKLKPKVFSIGLNRTGSSSLGRFFEMLGYKHSFETYSADQIQMFLNDEKLLRLEMDRFEMHEDWPTALVYKKLDKLYPDAKFILTLRDSADQWFNSVMNTSKQEVVLANKVKGLIYGHEIILEEHREELTAKYNKHYNEVVEYFKGTDKLLLLGVSDENKAKKVCEFVGYKKQVPEYPHTQKRTY